MRATATRILLHGLIAAALLGGLGFAFAEFAGAWFQEKVGDRPAPAGGAEVTDALQWRVPLTMAGWGLGIVVLIELVGGLWRKPEMPAAEAKADRPPVPDAEELLAKLLDEADAAERAREGKG